MDKKKKRILVLTVGLIFSVTILLVSKFVLVKKQELQTALSVLKTENLSSPKPIIEKSSYIYYAGTIISDHGDKISINGPSIYGKHEIYIKDCYVCQSFELDDARDGFEGTLVIYRSKLLMHGGNENADDSEFFTIVRLIDKQGKTCDVEYSSDAFALREEYMCGSKKRSFFTQERREAGHGGFVALSEMFEISGGEFKFISAKNKTTGDRKEIEFSSPGMNQLDWTYADYPKQSVKIPKNETWRIFADEKTKKKKYIIENTF